MIKNKKGQSIVETALVLPLIVLILTGIVDFGLLFNNYLILSNASREAARAAAVGTTDIEIGELIADITGTLDAGNLSIVIEPSGSSRVSGEEVSITLSYDNELLTPVISAILPNPISLESRSVMRVE